MYCMVMSQPEESSISPPGGDEDQNLSEPEELDSAIAPEFHLKEGHSQFSAMQCLDELFSLGKISGDKVARLMASLNLLNDTLKSSQESELSLLQDAKRYRIKLEHQQQELEKAELLPEGQDTEVIHMRMQLLQCHNMLLEAEAREYQMQYTLECLQEEKVFLEKEYMNQPKSAVEEKQFMALQESCEEMKMEIIKWHQEIKAVSENMEACLKQMQMELQELEEKKEIIESKEAELAQLLPIPTQLCKRSERINQEKINIEKNKAELEKQLQELVDLRNSTQVCCRQLEEERRIIMRDLEDRRSQQVVTQRDNNRLLKELEMTREKEAILLEQRGLLDISLNQVMTERKMFHDILLQKAREKERLLRSLKKMQLQVKVSKDVLLHTRDLYNKTKAQRDMTPINDDMLRKAKDLQKEIDTLKVVHRDAMIGIDSKVVEGCIEQELTLKSECDHCREELHHLHTLTHIKTDEKDQKSRELLKAQVRCSRIKQDVHGKQLQIQEHNKQYQEIQSKLAVFAKLYDVIKSERNKCMSLIQTATQRATEMREKLKIWENEIEILRTTATNKDRLLQKSRLKHVHSLKIRDSLKNDISKELWLRQEMRRKRRDQRLNITKLAHIINGKEQDLLHLCKSYETFVQSRNEKGVQLLERENELCMCYEKVHVQESQIHKKALEIQAREEEIQSLKMLIGEERRQIKKGKKHMHCRRTLEDECALMQIQLSECKDQMMSLENALKDQTSEKRSRKLSGKDLAPEELIQKIEQLEVQLTDKESQLLEKELIYEQVTRLSEHICTKAENSKDDTLGLAKKVNEVQGRIKKCTKKLMAVVSELAMRQAQALCLQQELRERELQLDSCHSRLDLGLAPSDDIEQEWQRYLRDQQKRQTDALEKAQMAEEEEWIELPNGVYTTSELRPSAYIPVEDSLPLPKPYGALAPFKPTKPGTNMRHIRKPVSKPIEI